MNVADMLSSAAHSLVPKQLPAWPLRCDDLQLPRRIPVIAFGTAPFSVDTAPGVGAINRDLIRICSRAIDAGLLHIDSSDSYNTEREIGYAIRETLIPRDDLYLSSKAQLDWDHIEDSIDRTLGHLGVKCLDLYLLTIPSGAPRPSKEQSEEFDWVLECAGITPIANQLHFHDYLMHRDKGFVSAMQLLGCQIMVFDILNTVRKFRRYPFDQLLDKMARKYDAPRQNLLYSWVLSRDLVVITSDQDPHGMDWLMRTPNIRMLAHDREYLAMFGLSYLGPWWNPRKDDIIPQYIVKPLDFGSGTLSGSNLPSVTSEDSAVKDSKGKGLAVDDEEQGTGGRRAEASRQGQRNPSRQP
ncbi:NADP-dependent oxidoreductase domain-containing protein [Lasiosphaeria miniovina]|uniref:NADP-dependent oxidoreductase domain-containing protein n=1 Tax=Lasiosphaeria miniovina TaxID=1954250 RepID=A0AA40DXH2_9PEZI|nr:NADP-dependent oxidoreductase domain-containing protein [Lasiosphaeria miniovina]KAK0717262.1 NADP-dependent oxidoreductase domain-containing protein [Lasiosphaeria miniovina]